MIDGIERAESRIQQIEGLLNVPKAPNEEFSRNEEFSSVLTGSTSTSGSGGVDACPPDLRPVVENASAQTGVPSDLISAVIQAESNFHNGEVSPTGAQGLMQLMPGTARALGVTDPFDPAQNVLGGARYLREQLDRFGSVKDALAAYNAGPGAVQRYGGVPPYRETQQYVKKIMGTLEQETR